MLAPKLYRIYFLSQFCHVITSFQKVMFLPQSVMFVGWLVWFSSELCKNSSTDFQKRKDGGRMWHVPRKAPTKFCTDPDKGADPGLKYCEVGLYISTNIHYSWILMNRILPYLGEWYSWVCAIWCALKIKQTGGPWLYSTRVPFKINVPLVERQINFYTCWHKTTEKLHFLDFQDAVKWLYNAKHLGKMTRSCAPGDYLWCDLFEWITLASYITCVLLKKFQNRLRWIIDVHFLDERLLHNASSAQMNKEVGGGAQRGNKNNFE